MKACVQSILTMHASEDAPATVSWEALADLAVARYITKPVIPFGIDPEGTEQ